MSKNFKLFDISDELKQKLLSEFNKLYGFHGNKMALQGLQDIIMRYFVPHCYTNNKERWITRELEGENSSRGFHHYAPRIEIKFDKDDNIIDFNANMVSNPLDLLLEEIMIYNPIDTSRYDKMLRAISIDKYDEIPFKDFLEDYGEHLIPQDEVERQSKVFAEKYLKIYRDLKSHGIETFQYLNS